jgi:hypothetical protein
MGKRSLFPSRCLDSAQTGDLQGATFPEEARWHFQQGSDLMPFNLRSHLQKLGPYMSLLVLAAPTAVVELSKAAAVFFLGDGHWATGLVVLVCAYAFSLFVTERMFQIVKPKLMRLPWFKTVWTIFVAVRQKTLQWLHSQWRLTTGR